MKVKIIYRKDVIKKIEKIQKKSNRQIEKVNKNYAKYQKAWDKWEKEKNYLWQLEQKVSGLRGHLSSMDVNGKDFLTVC